MGKRTKKRRLRRDNPAWRDRVRTAAETEWLVGAVMLDAGIAFRAGEMQSGKTRIPHWQFRWEGGQLDYWPSKGNWWHKGSGKKGTCPTPGDVIPTVLSFQGKAFACRRCGGPLTLDTLRLREGIICADCNEDIMHEAACEAEYLAGI